jgi:hypothetical protein
MPDHVTRHNRPPGHARFCECPDCRTAWEEWHEAKYHERVALRDIELRHARPATDQEWAEFLDAEFPRVKERVS